MIKADFPSSKMSKYLLEHLVADCCRNEVTVWMQGLLMDPDLPAEITRRLN